MARAAQRCKVELSALCGPWRLGVLVYSFYRATRVQRESIYVVPVFEDSVFQRRSRFALEQPGPQRQISAAGVILQFGDFELTIIRECTFSLDGGALFGVVPKALWSKTCCVDESNRVKLACNLLLIESPHGAALVETGMGARWNESERKRFQMNTLVDPSNMVASAGLQHSDIEIVILSHLHFDHAGGATTLQDERLVPAFPRAKYYVQRGEREFAQSANARARGSYRSSDYEPLEEAGVLQLIEGDQEILPGVRVMVTGGHTAHHQAVMIESEDKRGIYFADIIPTKDHLSPPWVMGYDHFPLQSCDVKNELLTRAANENWLVIFDHEVGTPWGHVGLSNKGKFEWHPLPADTLQN